MDSIYAETINSFSNDLDNLLKNKNAFSSVNCSNRVSIEEGNFCSYNRFMLSSARGTGDDIGLNDRQSIQSNTVGGSGDTRSMSLIDRLAKTAAIWTLPDLTRSQTDKILNDFAPGIFIVRMNNDKKTMVLSYKMKNQTQHVMIKVNVQRGFYMDGSEHVFRSVNHMIAHYMKHPVCSPDLMLKLPRALMEAHEVAHFQFFENMKINFWTTLLASKSINDIWSKPIHDSRTEVKTDNTGLENCPPVPPRGYNANELNMLQGQADACDIEDVYSQIAINNRRKIPHPSLPSIPPPPPPKTSPIIEKESKIQAAEESEYSQLWRYASNTNSIQTSKELQFNDILKCLNNSDQLNKNERPKLLMKPSEGKFSCPPSNVTSNTKSCITIPKIIEDYYPQLIYHGLQLPLRQSPCPSLQENILQKDPEIPDDPLKPPNDNNDQNYSEPIYNGQYETPWDIKNTWITKLMDLESRDTDNQNNLLTEFGKVGSDLNEKCSRSYSLPAVPNTSLGSNKDLSYSTESDEDEEESMDGENCLQAEYLKEIEPVMFSPSESSEIYFTYKSQFGQSIRKFLTKLCSRQGDSDIAKSINLFIKCTIERNDLSPYTTMRLIRQYMSGLKNLITKNKKEFSLNDVINEEIKHTPKNVFINLDSIIESVLTKYVVKPLRAHVYKLLVLEHYKNNNLKQIADGVETSKLKSFEKLGLTEEIKSLIDSKIESIRRKFTMISKQFSPEQKIKYMIGIVDIVFNMLKSIYTKTEVEIMEIDIKSESVLPLFVYIFSQCKVEAMATQCEVEYVEGLIWSSKLVNGEPGFFLLNLMSSLEAVKVFSRPKLNNSDVLDLSCKSSIRINNSSFFTKIDPSSLSNAAIGSVNVIIMDEKINRLVTKIFPVRSTVTVNSLCNTIAHRLGIFNPKDYNLYKYTGFDEFLLKDHECPLIIKQTFQQQTGENINFLFRRRNANFIIPSDIPAR